LQAPLASVEIEMKTKVPTTDKTIVQTEGMFPIDFHDHLETIEKET
jgi:hypothetical protein